MTFEIGAAPVAAACHATFAFEIGQDVDLDQAERRSGPTERQTVRSRRRVPQHFEYRPAPLRLAQDPTGVAAAGLRAQQVEVVLFDFGAAAVNYRLAYEGPLEGLVGVAVALETEVALRQDARRRLQELLPALGPSVTRPRLTDQVEDYLVIEIRALPQGLSPASLLREAGSISARILRASNDPLAPEEVAEALSQRLVFGVNDVTVVDWNAALVADPEAEDTRALLEFANVQLLELRHLDQELDAAVERAYDALARSEQGWWRALRPPAGTLRAVGELQIDAAILFERVSNAVKLVGDQFLSRLHVAVSRRFHFEDWDRSISRKLAAIDGLYQKLSDRVVARRLEVLEWIVIMLIGLEVVLGLMR